MTQTKEYRQAYYQKNRERILVRTKAYAATRKDETRAYKLRWELKTRYGITLEDVQKMYDDQGGQCAICSLDLIMLEPKHTGRKNKNTVNVDHCHHTGKVRGLLCHHCNTGLGYFKDNPDNLIKGVKYLAHTGS